MADTPTTPTIASIFKKHSDLCEVMDWFRGKIREASDELAEKAAKLEAFGPDAIICRLRKNPVVTEDFQGYTQKARQIGFGKVGDQWCIALRKVTIAGEYDLNKEREVEDGLKPDVRDPEYIRLADAPRKILMAVLEEFPVECDDEDIIDAIRNNILQAMDERIDRMAAKLHQTFNAIEKKTAA